MKTPRKKMVRTKNSLSIFLNKAPWALLICLALLLITESFIRKNVQAIVGLEDSLFIQRKSHLNGPKKLDYDGILIGDSRIIGINAKLISQTFSDTLKEDHNFHNFSLLYSDIRAHYILLKNYLEKHKKPQYIIFSSMPEATFNGWNIIYEMYNKHTHIYRFGTTFPLKDIYLTLPFRDFLKFIPIKTEGLSELFTYRGFIYSILVGKRRLQLEAQSYLNRSIDQKNGGVILGNTGHVTQKSIKRSLIYAQSTTMNENSVLWLEKFFQLAQENNIQVIMFNMPLLSSIYDQRMDNGFNKKYLNLLNELLKKYKNVTFIGPKIRTYDQKYFDDFSHLNTKGFDRFDKELNDILKQYLLNAKN